MNDTIRKQVEKFGYVWRNELSDCDNVVVMLNMLNNTEVTPSALSSVSVAGMKIVHLNDIVYHVGRMQNVEPHVVPVDGIAGVVVKCGEKYRLIDGYHRYKWLKSNGIACGVYILLE